MSEITMQTSLDLRIKINDIAVVHFNEIDIQQVFSNAVERGTDGTSVFAVTLNSILSNDTISHQLQVLALGSAWAKLQKEVLIPYEQGNVIPIVVKVESETMTHVMTDATLDGRNIQYTGGSRDRPLTAILSFTGTFSTAYQSQSK